MNEIILCLVALFFLAWVLILKSENNQLKSDNQKMIGELRRLGRLKPTGLNTTASKFRGKSAPGNASPSSSASKWPA